MWDRLHASMRHWFRLVGAASPGARALERHGVVASVVPAAPERAVSNSVAYESAAGLAAAYDEVAAAYRDIGANWTVWVHPDDAEAAELLERHGHVLDAQPVGMVRDLRGGVERPPADPLDGWTAAGDLAAVGPLNDRSYPFGTDSFTRTLRDLPPDGITVYAVPGHGPPVACLLMIDHPPNSEVQMVAVAPEARGRGLSANLLAHALADAAERGIESSTLVATRLGRPVYDRLGFEPLGAFQMWERRT